MVYYNYILYFKSNEITILPLAGFLNLYLVTNVNIKGYKCNLYCAYFCCFKFSTRQKSIR